MVTDLKRAPKGRSGYAPSPDSDEEDLVALVRRQDAERENVEPSPTESRPSNTAEKRPRQTVAPRPVPSSSGARPSSSQRSRSIAQQAPRANRLPSTPVPLRDSVNTQNLPDRSSSERDSTPQGAFDDFYLEDDDDIPASYENVARIMRAGKQHYDDEEWTDAIATWKQALLLFGGEPGDSSHDQLVYWIKKAAARREEEQGKAKAAAAAAAAAREAVVKLSLPTISPEARRCLEERAQWRAAQERSSSKTLTAPNSPDRPSSPLSQKRTRSPTAPVEPEDGALPPTKRNRVRGSGKGKRTDMGPPPAPTRVLPHRTGTNRSTSIVSELA